MEGLVSNPIIIDFFGKCICESSIAKNRCNKVCKVEEPPITNIMNKINKVTKTNLDISLRMCGYQLDKNVIDIIVDLVELIEEKGDAISIRDVRKLRSFFKIK